MITLDDGGNKSTGKILGGLYCTVDSFSGRDDIFTAYFSNDVMNGRADNFQYQFGTAVGLRGKVGRKAYWEAFVSWALKKPADMPNGKQVYGFKYMMELQHYVLGLSIVLNLKK